MDEEEVEALFADMGIVDSTSEYSDQDVTESNVTRERANQVFTVLKLVEAGSFETTACRVVGINRMTFRANAFKLDAAKSYARAFTALAHHQAEQIEKTITDMRNNVVDAQQARVEIDARKWFASRFLPRTYGDKVINMSGEEDSHEKYAKATARALAAMEEITTA